MPTTRNAIDLDILRELIDCLRLYERSNADDAVKHRSAQDVCLSSDKVRSTWETRQAVLDKLEQGMLRLSYDYLGIKLGIAVVLAAEARGEGMDAAELREQIESAVAYAGDGTDGLQGEEVDVASLIPEQVQQT